jgi:two-component system cell cycle sensor histidine kinase/response regulator CckA
MHQRTRDGIAAGVSREKQLEEQVRADASMDAQGTVGSVFLPRAAGGGPAPEEPHVTVPPHAGHETILLVEDDELVRRLLRRSLAGLGYQVLEAGNGQDALAVLHACPSPIDLVLSDVVMPDLSGTELVGRVQARSPGTRALFMSGHINHALLQQGALEASRHFIQKPFMPKALAQKVREVLDA